MGGVSERPTQERRGAILSRSCRRNGRRHPGSRGAGNLRGVPEECEPRPVRFVRRGLFLDGRSHRRQRVSSGSQGGERRQRTPSARTRRGDAEKSAPPRFEDTSFTRSRDPCTSTSLPSSKAGASRPSISSGAFGWVSRSGKPAKAGGTGTGVQTNGRIARLAACHRSSGDRRGPGVMRKKRKKVEAFVPARNRESRREPVRRNAVAEVDEQHLGLE